MNEWPDPDPDDPIFGPEGAARKRAHRFGPRLTIVIWTLAFVVFLFDRDWTVLFVMLVIGLLTGMMATSMARKDYP